MTTRLVTTFESALALGASVAAHSGEHHTTSQAVVHTAVAVTHGELGHAGVLAKQAEAALEHNEAYGRASAAVMSLVDAH